LIYSPTDRAGWPETIWGKGEKRDILNF